jgi:hypothetical protein
MPDIIVMNLRMRAKRALQITLRGELYINLFRVFETNIAVNITNPYFETELIKDFPRIRESRRKTLISPVLTKLFCMLFYLMTKRHLRNLHFL